jgi:hypothetical protein
MQIFAEKPRAPPASRRVQPAEKLCGIDPPAEPAGMPNRPDPVADTKPAGLLIQWNKERGMSVVAGNAS